MRRASVLVSIGIGLVLSPATAPAAALPASLAADDPAAIVLELEPGDMRLRASAIADDVATGAAAVLFAPAAVATAREARPAAPLLFVLEDPEERGRRHGLFARGQLAGLGGRAQAAPPSLLDCLLILCAPFVLPLLTRRRTPQVRLDPDERRPGETWPM